MTHSEKRIYLLKELLLEQPQYRNMEIPDNAKEQKRFLRSLMNIRSPRPIGTEFLKVQDEYLSEEVKEKVIVLPYSYCQMKKGDYKKVVLYSFKNL